MRSMTGYGRASAQINGTAILVELRAVNHRFLECSVKAPRQYAFLEDAVKREAAARIARGKVEIFVSVDALDGDSVSVAIHTDLAKRYLEALRELARDCGLPEEISVMDLARLPDVLGSERAEPDADALTQDVLTVFREACDAFNTMREREGAHLADDILARCDEMENLIALVEERAPERVRLYREKLLARMQEVLADRTIDETRILTEAAIYADRTAVDEETVRLRSHLHQLRLLLEEDQAIGRKLDFLLQEMNREANTIGSKANDVEIAGTVVALKSALEKIREQAQNVE